MPSEPNPGAGSKLVSKKSEIVEQAETGPQLTKTSAFGKSNPEQLGSSPNLVEQVTRGAEETFLHDTHFDANSIGSILIYDQLDYRSDFQPSAEFLELIGTGHKERFEKNSGFAFRLKEYEGKDNPVEFRMESETSAYFGQLKTSESGQAIKEGQGYLSQKESVFYAGYFKDDKFDGPGMLISRDCSYYYGIWKRNKLNGIGFFKSAEGRTYQGMWVNNLQEGQGEERWETSGSYYKGEFQRGLRHGKGSLFISDEGITYRGDFRHNVIDGFGEYVWLDGKSYRGGWKKDQMHGKGVFTWPDNRMYEGDYFEGKKHGSGVFTWPDGRRYDGEWKRGLQNGHGTLVSATGEKIEGEWLDGVLQR